MGDVETAVEHFAYDSTVAEQHVPSAPGAIIRGWCPAIRTTPGFGFNGGR